MAIQSHAGASKRTQDATAAFNAAQAKQQALVRKYNTLLAQMQAAKAETKQAYAALEQAWEADKAN